MTTTVLRPIETIYKGYRFRSRLEARWAVFFDHCEEQWIYEDQGYLLPSGPYLPDFWFPKRRALVEVKPDNQLPNRNFEFDLVDGSRYPIDDDFPREIVNAFHLSRQLGLQAGHFVIVYGDPLTVLKSRTSITISKHGPVIGTGFLHFLPPNFAAVDAARAARFEHGETPSVSANHSRQDAWNELISRLFPKGPR